MYRISLFQEQQSKTNDYHTKDITALPLTKISYVCFYIWSFHIWNWNPFTCEESTYENTFHVLKFNMWNVTFIMIPLRIIWNINIWFAFPYVIVFIWSNHMWIAIFSHILKDSYMESQFHDEFSCSHIKFSILYVEFHFPMWYFMYDTAEMEIIPQAWPHVAIFPCILSRVNYQRLLISSVLN